MQKRKAGIVEENRTAPAPYGGLPQGRKVVKEVNVEAEAGVNEYRGIAQACKCRMNSN